MELFNSASPDEALNNNEKKKVHLIYQYVSFEEDIAGAPHRLWLVGGARTPLSGAVEEEEEEAQEKEGEE